MVLLLFMFVYFFWTPIFRKHLPQTLSMHPCSPNNRTANLNLNLNLNHLCHYHYHKRIKNKSVLLYQTVLFQAIVWMSIYQMANKSKSLSHKEWEVVCKWQSITKTIYTLLLFHTYQHMFLKPTNNKKRCKKRCRSQYRMALNRATRSLSTCPMENLSKLPCPMVWSPATNWRWIVSHVLARCLFAKRARNLCIVYLFLLVCFFCCLVWEDETDGPSSTVPQPVAPQPFTQPYMQPIVAPQPFYAPQPVAPQPVAPQPVAPQPVAPVPAGSAMWADEK